MAKSGKVVIHTDPADFDGMRKAGKLAAETLDMITPYVEAGITTEELDKICDDYINAHGGISACKGYHGYPKSVCISLNHVICHGIPSDRKLVNGDILNIDVTTIVDGWYGDTSRMYTVGKLPVKAKKLVEITFETMWRGIEQVKPGNTLGDIGHAMQSFAEKNRCSVVKDFCGHGLGQIFHDAPNVLNYGKPHEGLVLEPGMFFTIEPMVNTGGDELKILADGWTTVTRDMGLSAQFEHSLAVTETGYEIFTNSPKGLDHPPYDLSLFK